MCNGTPFTVEKISPRAGFLSARGLKWYGVEQVLVDNVQDNVTGCGTMPLSGLSMQFQCDSTVNKLLTSKPDTLMIWLKKKKLLQATFNPTERINIQ